jgi:hypothetical protein
MQKSQLESLYESVVQVTEGQFQRRVAQAATADTGYGAQDQRKVPEPNTYSGEKTSRHSVAAALKTKFRANRKGDAPDMEQAGKAVHDAWNKQAQKDINNPNSKTSPEKKAARQKLINTKYKNLPEVEKEKDRKFAHQAYESVDLMIDRLVESELFSEDEILNIAESMFSKEKDNNHRPGYKPDPIKKVAKKPESVHRRGESIGPIKDTAALAPKGDHASKLSVHHHQ